jgi:hypothetical protein
MAIPGFTADRSLLTPTRAHRKAGSFTAPGDADLVAPQALPACLDACQQSWSNCLGGCSWWEWVIGSCIPRCRAEWLVCVGRC